MGPLRIHSALSDFTQGSSVLDPLLVVIYRNDLLSQVLTPTCFSLQMIMKLLRGTLPNAVAELVEQWSRVWEIVASNPQSIQTNNIKLVLITP